MTADPTHPSVFVSHASEDKDRFVLPFAARLRARGVDAWVDRWEMLPGDSLAGKIFREGLDKASAVIVVLSRVSITKRWVAEELDAAVVKRINEGSRLIPIVLDGLNPRTEVPSPIRHLLFENVPNPEALDDVIDHVVRSIFGEVERPPLGSPPSYTSAPAARIGDLDRIDSLVLRSAGAEAVHDGGTSFTTAEFLASITIELGISEADAIASLEVLDGGRYVGISRTLGGGLRGMRRFELTSHGLQTYLRSYEPAYPTIEATVIAHLAAWPEQQGTEQQLTEAVGAPRLIVQHVLEDCALRRLVTLSDRVGGPAGAHFFGISPRLRRLADT